MRKPRLVKRAKRKKMDDKKPITAERIKALRKSMGLNQEQLADKLDIKRPSLSRIETGDTGLTAKNIEKFCRFFGVTSDYLLFGQDSFALGGFGKDREEIIRAVEMMAENRSFRFAVLSLYYEHLEKSRENGHKNSRQMETANNG